MESVERIEQTTLYVAFNIGESLGTWTLNKFAIFTCMCIILCDNRKNIRIVNRIKKMGKTGKKQNTRKYFLQVFFFSLDNKH